MSNLLETLDPAFRTKLEEALAEAKKAGIRMTPYEMVRTPQSQGAIWRRSRTAVQVKLEASRLVAAGAPFLADCILKAPATSGKWATNSVPGMSWHQWGQACDLFWEKVPGKAEWTDITGYAKFAEICKRRGLTHGYFWRSKDSPHVQMPAASKPDLPLPEIDKIMKARFG